jgi:hypothetical protein
MACVHRCLSLDLPDDRSMPAVRAMLCCCVTDDDSRLAAGNAIMLGELGVWDGRERRVQAQVRGPLGEAELPVHHVQDRRADAAGGGGQGGAARRGL